MKRIYCCILLFFIAFNTVKASASNRNFVINEINTQYYSSENDKIIDAILQVDVSLDDDEYLKKVFECLDEHSEYYTKDEYESQVVYGNNGMISASLSKKEIIIKINRFGNGVDEIFLEYMQKCKKERTKRIVLDLTECPGGYVNVMNVIANEIMPKGKVMTAKFRNNEQVYYSDLEKCPFDEIIVKVSSQTASAAEILAAGLQEAGVAKVVGVNTYGKTSIQSFHRLESGAAFKLTCGEYLTRNGNDISKTGVIPDIVDYSYPVKIRWNDYCKEVFRNNKAVSE